MRLGELRSGNGQGGWRQMLLRNMRLISKAFIRIQISGYQTKNQAEIGMRSTIIRTVNDNQFIDRNTNRARERLSSQQSIIYSKLDSNDLVGRKKAFVPILHFNDVCPKRSFPRTLAVNSKYALVLTAVFALDSIQRILLLDFMQF